MYPVLFNAPEVGDEVLSLVDVAFHYFGLVLKSEYLKFTRKNDRDFWSI